jgi:imidazolonepropionase-like amidohydrolase
MRRRLPPVAVLCAAAALSALIGTAAFGQLLSPSNGYLALVGGTIYVNPIEDPIRDGVVLLQGGKIVSVGNRASRQVPRDAQSLDCAGLVIVAGFWNSHVHFFERKWADAATIPAPELGRQLQGMLTQYGFTNAFDLGSLWANTRRLRDRIESGEVAGPRIRSTGEGLLPPNPGIPPDNVLNFMGVMKTPVTEVVDATQAAVASRKFLDDGVDGIKLFASAPSKALLPEGAIAAAANEAHRLGKPVFVHPNTSAEVLSAIRGGVDVIAHTTPRTDPWDETTLSAMKERGVALTPTLTLWKYYLRHDRLSTQERTTNTAVGQLRAWVAAGGTVLFGNDLGAVDYDPSEEYGLMSEAGMSLRQILASLTTAPAERFGESDRRGRIAAGLQADLVVLKHDPAKNIRALAEVQYTLRAGKIIYRASE